MILRQAELKDKKEIMDIANLLYLEIPKFLWNSGEFITKQVEKKEYFLIKDNDSVVGVMSLRQRKNGVHIETLVVKKEFQSKGLGTKLIEFAKKFAKEKGNNSLYAYSFSEYNIADFYLKKRFKLMGYVGYYKNRKYDCFKIKL